MTRFLSLLALAFLLHLAPASAQELRPISLSAILELSTDSNTEVSRYACSLITPRLGKKMLSAQIDALKRAALKKSVCATRLLFSGAYRFQEKDRTFLTKIRKQKPNLAARGFADLGIVSSIPKSSSVEIDARLAKNVDALLKKRVQLSARRFSQTLQHFLKVADLRSEKVAVSEDARTRLNEMLTLSGDSLDRSVYVAVLSRDAAPAQVVKLLKKTTGYFERIPILNTMKTWTPKQSWAIPHLVELLREPDPMVFEIIAVLKAIREPQYDGLIGYALQPALLDKTFGEFTGQFLATLENGDLWTSFVLDARPEIASPMIRRRLVHRCNAVVLSKLVEGPNHRSINQFVVLLYRFRCEEKVGSIIADHIENSKNPLFAQFILQTFPEFLNQIDDAAARRIRFMNALAQSDITDVGPELRRAAIEKLDSDIALHASMAVKIVRRAELQPDELKSLNDLAPHRLLELFAERKLPSQFLAKRSTKDDCDRLASAAVSAPDQSMYLKAFYGRFDESITACSKELTFSMNALCSVDRDGMLKAANRSNETQTKLTIWKACGASGKELTAATKVSVDRKNSAVLQNLVLERGDGKTIKTVLRKIAKLSPPSR